MEQRMVDEFDRSGFVLDMMDSNSLYNDRLVGGDDFTMDIFWNTQRL